MKIKVRSFSIFLMIFLFLLTACEERKTGDLKLLPSLDTQTTGEAKGEKSGAGEKAHGEKAVTEKQPVGSAELSQGAIEAKNKLEEGNRRFTSERPETKEISEGRRKNLAQKGQNPFAVILGCSDSRVPPEVLFDQALGDLFVIRNAGNVADPLVLGSVEYGAEHLKAPLIVVMGHSGCGAVKATVDGASVSPNIYSIVEKIKPSLEVVRSNTKEEGRILDLCIEENVRNSVKKVMQSPVI